MSKRILVIGTSTYHMRRWFHYVTPNLPKEIEVDIYTIADDATTDMFDGANKVYFTRETPKILRFLLKIPKVRAIIMSNDQNRTLESILKKKKYNAVNIHQLFPASLIYVKLAKKYGVKVILTPWGSDVLRCPKYQIPMMRKVFSMADYVTYNIDRFSEKYIKTYHVSPQKMFYAGFGSEIFDLIPQFSGRFTKAVLAEKIGIPYADYYITCGYMADYAQRHKYMINAIGKNKDMIPPNTLLLFPFTYGNGRNETYMSELRELCDLYGLRYHFVTDYLTNEQMAMFRIIADLFIHIQPTDASSASLMEYLLAGVQCVNGKWLDYPSFEKDGMPYHICNTLEELPNLIKSFFEGKLSNCGISDRVRTEMMNGAWSKQKWYWKDLYELI